MYAECLLCALSYSSSEEYAFLAPFYSWGNLSPVVKSLAVDSVGTARIQLKPQQCSGKLLGSYGQGSLEPPKLRRPRKSIALAETQRRSGPERWFLSGDLGHQGQATVLPSGVMVSSHALSRGLLHHKLKARRRGFSEPVLQKQGACRLCPSFFPVHTRKPGPPFHSVRCGSGGHTWVLSKTSTV